MKRKQILIVEDERIIAEDLKKTLVKFGYEVCSVVSSGIAAVEKADELRPDMILMDILLESDMTGIEAAEQIRTIFNIPVIYLTAYADDATLKKAKITEPFAYLLKPFEEKELKAAIEMSFYKSDMEKEKQKSENQFRQLIETMNDGLIIQDEYGLMTYANYRFCRMLNLAHNDIIGKHITAFINKEEHKIFKQRMMNWKKGYQEPYEQIFVGKDDQKIYTYVSPKPKFDDFGFYRGAFEVITDITEIKKAGEQIRNQNIFYKNTIDSLSHPFLVIDADNFNVVIANTAAKFSKKITSQTCHQLLKNRNELCDGSEHPCPITTVKNTKIPTMITRNYLNDDGKRIFLEIHAYPIFDKQNEVKQVIAYLIDVTERKEIERQFLRSERLAGIGELAAGIAHEIKNPLGNISFAAQFCLNEFKMSKELRQYIEIMLRNSQNANKIIKELLDFANPRDINLRLKDINSILDSTLNLVQGRCKNSKIEIIKDYGDSIAKVKLDEKWIEQALVNIILNSIEAIKQDGSITLKTEQLENTIIVIITDTGPGIPEDIQQNIFDPFFTTKESGVGLGLSLVHQIIKEHNGKLSIRSDKGIGTAITLEFPV